MAQYFTSPATVDLQNSRQEPCDERLHQFEPAQLFRRLGTVSLETMVTVRSLPSLDIQQPVKTDLNSKHAEGAPALTVVADNHRQQKQAEEIEQGMFGPDGVPCAMVNWNRS